MLERLGALGDLPQRARSVMTVAYKEGERTLLELKVGRAAEKTLLISQAEVENALRQRLLSVGGGVEWSTRLIGLRHVRGGVSVSLQHGDGSVDETHVTWLVGCDGAHSAVRRAAGIPFPGRQIVERLLMIDVRADWPFDPDGSITWVGKPMVSVTAMPGSTWRVFAEAPTGLAAQPSEHEVADRVLHELQRCSGIDPKNTDYQVRWATEVRINRRLAEHYRDRHVLLAGDAAHIQSPSGGQGQNTGLADAENLAWKLVLATRGVTTARLLDTYEQERRPLAARVLTATTAAVEILLPDRRWKRFLRDRLALPALRLPFLQRRLWVAASQLKLSYRGGPLAPAAPRFLRSPRPGDRVDDLDCRRPGRAGTPLHRAIEGRWVLLAASWADADRHARIARLRLGDDLVTTLTPTKKKVHDVMLVRPDGHLAWRSRPDPAGLSGWFDRVLCRA